MLPKFRLDDQKQFSARHKGEFSIFARYSPTALHSSVRTQTPRCALFLSAGGLIQPHALVARTEELEVTQMKPKLKARFAPVDTSPAFDCVSLNGIHCIPIRS